ncbi:MAG: NFACT RNA binding domain-containing protein [Cytophagaceae bacterium]
MHNNYFFIQHLASELKERLPGKILQECFSQTKEELLLGFGPERFFIQAHLGSEFSTLSFPDEFHRAKKNSVNLFEELIGEKVEDVKAIKGERAFKLCFSSGFTLLFKLFGNRSNILLYHHEELQKLFKNKLKQDLSLNPDQLPRSINYSDPDYSLRLNDLMKEVPVLGPEVKAYLESRAFNEKDVSERGKLYSELLDNLLNPTFYLLQENGYVRLSLIGEGEVVESYSSALAVATAFYRAWYRVNYLRKTKDLLNRKISSLITKTENYLKIAYDKLLELSEKESPSQIADVIMANLHAIKNSRGDVSLHNFYTDSSITIHLKQDQSPQKYAEQLYRKAKQRPLEIQKAEERISHTENLLLELRDDLKSVQSSEYFKGLEPFLDKYSKSSNQSNESLSAEERFKHIEFMGFHIYIGKSSANNDILTQKFARKDDLWLHAKDVSGSHVVIKQQAGKNFPKPVIEKAASLAAYYSKRRNDSLCPVIVTEKKYVRKIKGAPAGAVKVDRETVVMVIPKDI